MNEALPLSTVHNAVLEFLRDRDDVVVFGAQAVNAYVDEPRMTQDIDLMSPRAEALAEEIRQHLSQRFHIAVRVREVAEGRLADVRLELKPMAACTVVLTSRGYPASYSKGHPIFGLEDLQKETVFDFSRFLGDAEQE